MLAALSSKLHVGSKADRFSGREKRIYDFLVANPVGVLCTVTPDNNPHGSVIYFFVEKDFRITFITRSETRKRDNLRHNNHVMLTVFDPKSQSTAQIMGVTKQIEGSYDVNGVAGHVFASSRALNKTGLLPITKLEAGPYVAFEIHPVQIRMATYGKANSGDYTQLFESIESFDLIT